MHIKKLLCPSVAQFAMKVIEPFLITPLEFDVCPNDCVIFRGAHANLLSALYVILSGIILRIGISNTYLLGLD